MLFSPIFAYIKPMLGFIKSGLLKDHNFLFMILTTAVISANRENYTCAYCSGLVTTTDYIESIKDNPELLLSLDKLVAICRPCNGRKGIKSKVVFLAKPLTHPVFITFISPLRAIRCLKATHPITFIALI